MNKAIFDNNMNLIKIKYREIYNCLIDYESSKDGRVYIDESVKGEEIISIKFNEHIYYLNSRYDDEEFVNKWFENFDKIKYREVFLIFGLSNFKAVKKLVNNINDNNIVLLYEPDVDIFYKAVHITDITEIFGMNNVFLCVKGVNEKCFKEFLLRILDYSNMRLLNYFSLPNYDKVYENEWKKVLNDIKYRFEQIIGSKYTWLRYSGEFIKNKINNTMDMINEYTVNQLQEKVIEKEINIDSPAIIVAAGPSLNKNVCDLKYAQDRAFIIAVDTSIKTLFNNNIRPDLVITIDAHKPPILFAHKKFFDIPLVVCGITNYKLYHIHNGKRLYFHGGDKYMNYMYHKIKEVDLQPLETGGSVANNAFSLAQVLGFKDIILIGQDFAYPKNKGHVDEAYMGAEKEINNDNNKYFEVEDIYGNKVLTESNMNIYRRWFECHLERYPELKVIDATEGGAKIQGTEILTLKEAIERKCKKEIDKSILNDLEKTFDENEIDILKYEINDIEKKLNNLEGYIEKGIRRYEKLSKLSRENKVNSKDFKTVMNEIDEMVCVVEQDPTMDFISVYVKIDEYDVLGQINDIKEDVEDDIKDIVTYGTKILNAYKKGIKSLKSDLKKRTEISSEELEKLIKKIKNNIDKLDKEVNNNSVLTINELMKEFMVDILDLIDMQYLNNSSLYDKLVKCLKEIIIEFTDGNNFMMVKLMKEKLMEYLEEMI